MGLYDTDKTNDSRSDPTPNGADSLTSLRMSYGTQSISPVTDATTDTLQIITKDSTIELGQTGFNAGVGYWLGVDSDGIAKFSIGDSNGQYLTYDGTALTLNGSLTAASIAAGLITGDMIASATIKALNIASNTITGDNISALDLTGKNLFANLGLIGGYSIGSDYLRDSGNTFGLASTVTGGDDTRFWAGDSFANRGSAPFHVSKSGAVTASNMTLTGGSIMGTGMVALNALNLANRNWTQTCAFSVGSASQINWGSGTFLSADGSVSLSISSGNTGIMSAKTYIYLDTAISLSTYQTTTTASTAVGSNKVLIAIAQNGTNEATFQVLNGQGGQNIDASSIVANSITANELSTSLLYAGSLQIDTSGNVRSGQTSYDQGTGWFIGNSSGTPKFSIGNSSGNKITWDGTYLKLTGSASMSSALNNFADTVANLPISPTSVGFSNPSGNE